MGKNAGRFHPSEKYGFEVSLSHVSFQFAMTTPRVSSLGCFRAFPMVDGGRCGFIFLDISHLVFRGAF